ncbi:MAG TPA: YceI family protein [Pseudacidobacterium sp.]|jgi:polyisoprenoid-binding protein YceI|nr:YceI family protein [Pseudacidobacterium sp.]
MASTSTPASLITWKIDPAHTAAEFKVKHMMIANVKGTIKGITGDLTEHTTDASLSSIEATLDVSTLNTGEPQRDAHLKSADFLELEKYPTIIFKSTQVERKREEEYAVTGDLTIHGVTRPVTLAVEGPTLPQKDPWGNVRIGLEATTKIDRKDFGLIWNAALETGGILVGDTVQITIEAEFIKG